MTSNSPSGAVDHDYDDGERDPRTILEERLSDFPGGIRGQDLAIDTVKNRPLYVRRKVADTAVEYFAEQDFDLTTYRAHPHLPITPEDGIFECIFLPTKVEDIPGERGDKTYDYPEGRLARIPVEWLYNSDTTPQDDFRAALIASLLHHADGDNQARADETVERVARSAFSDGVVDDATKRAGIVPTDGDEE